MKQAKPVPPLPQADINGVFSVFGYKGLDRETLVLQADWRWSTADRPFPLPSAHIELHQSPFPAGLDVPKWYFEPTRAYGQIRGTRFLETRPRVSGTSD